ncbi:MATE family efflux transporter [Corynebacterium casei]|uniref:MATE family efflux transporter n=1 Tax=Corynebacterium casei TaxID=160386 RepID=UPI002647116E|nr:MATE family efflux transporter [Corynebacterium casei]MDN5799517.1 MATE family efflux transporter [Corynebacterium casei]MDN5825910.1 MATE family efflux transporter [Corynebacterium casei]MDN5839743.1 MATE family efflux transporter [Corynebacterium casei]MDN5883573.1 MATE family efflux transporter [Corynebacterium casei]MDN5921911.1 MATE family efflux transporter [Corynebacterium casei]
MTSSNSNSAEHVSARKVFGLALPALGVLAAMPLYLLLDTAVVGRLGAEQLAALGAAAAVQSVVTTQLTFLSYGTTARSSRLFGSGKKDEAVAEGVQATYVALIVGFALACVMWLFGGQIALWMTGNPETAELTAAWLHVAALAIPITLVEMAGNGWLRGIQDTKKPLYFTLAGLIPGAIAVPIFVHFWGLVGSAWANVLGMGIIAVLFLLELKKQHTGSWRLRPSVIKRQLVLGRDLIIRSASLQVAFLSAAAVAARFGTSPLAAHQVMLQIWNFLTLVLDSLAIAAQTLIGAALGAKSVDTARSAGQKIIGYSVIFSGGLAAVFALGAAFIPRIFTNDEAVLEAMRIPWWIMIAMIVAGGVLFAIDGVLLGAGDAAFLRTITVGSVIVGFLPGILIAYFLDLGLAGIWCGLAAFIGLRTIAVVFRFYSMRWAVVG